MTWAQAQSYCRETVGGQLAVLDDASQTLDSGGLLQGEDA